VTEFSNPSYESIGSTSSSRLDRVKANDQDAWRRLVKLYSPLVLFWCRRAGIPADNRADLFQDVFRAVTRYIGNFPRERSGSFRAWLRSIVGSKVADHFARHVEEIAVGGTEAQCHLMEIPDGVKDSAAACAPNEETLLIRQAIAVVQAEFEPKTWAAACRTIIDGRTATEVAEELGMTFATMGRTKCNRWKRSSARFPAATSSCR
jgi:RNA polymerase sigma-70 factor (ECF subfamily)